MRLVIGHESHSFLCHLFYNAFLRFNVMKVKG